MNQSRGFTLLELLVAVAIIGMIMTTATVAFRGILRGTHQTEARLEAQLDIDRAWFLIEDDILNIRWRGIRNSFGSTEAPILCESYGDYALALTRSGGRVQKDQDGVALNANLSRVAYQLRGDALYRLHWPFVDRSDETPQSRLVLEAVSAFDCNALKDQSTAGLSVDRPPLGLEITLETEANGRFARRFALGLNLPKTEAQP